ncbi:uncharacterized protein OCT59_028443 [Rhizophagus irregularis]|uniref:uncharacterized protein n=1 Tax=Rhizophagus irregularis TaxID=588596 RepID=UPI000CCB6486|nr:hypothetical protein OCT59_028443 [Rhizophagus irregularis]
MEDSRNIQIAENRFPYGTGEEHRFLHFTYTHYFQYCESLFTSFFFGPQVEVQNNILKANFGLSNEEILSWENRATRYKMTPQSFSFFLHVAMYSASQGFNAVYSGIKERSEGRKQMLCLVRKYEEKSKKGKKAKKNKKKKHQSEDSDSDVLTDVSTSGIMRNTDDDDDQLGVDQDVIINRSIADASGSQSHVDQHIDMDISTVQPISELDVMPQPQLVKQPVDNLTKSSNKKKKSNKNIIQQVITGHKPDDDGTSRIRNILVYDVPVSLTPEEILQQ